MAAAALLLCALAQFDAAAPEPPAPLSGALLLAADEPPGLALLERFLALAPGGPVCVLGAGEAGRDLCARLGPRARPLSLPSDAARDPLAEARAGGARAVWIAGSEAELGAALCADAPLARSLSAFLAAGGTVGAGGPLARRLDAPGAGLLLGLGVLGGEEDAAPRLAARPDLPLVRLPAGAALLAHGRELVLLGGAEVLLSGTDAERLAGVWSERGRRLDRIALVRAAAARASPPPAPGVPEVPAGALLLAGGGALPAGALARFIELAGGPDAPLVVIPCTAERTLAEEPAMAAELRSAGARDVTWIHAARRADADGDPRVLAPLLRARGVWLGSGRAFELIDRYENTEVHRLLHAVLARGGVVGGSSAGASVMAGTLVRGGPLDNRDVLAAGYERGFGFLPGAAVDQHFRERARFPDLLALKRARPELLAIGIDEGTALLVQGTVGEVLGRGEVAFLDTAGAPESPEGAATRAAAGGRYDLVLRRPLE